MRVAVVLAALALAACSKEPGGGTMLVEREPPKVATASTTPPPTVIQTRTSKPLVPIRAPYRGICDCPYDVARDGSICGGRSAWSKPGGREPKCY